MKLTGPACTEATSGAKEAGRGERAEGKAGGVRVERRVRRDGEAIGILDYECMPPINRTSKATMDTVDSAIAGICSSFLRICMTPVKNMSKRIMTIGFLLSKKYRLIAIFDLSKITNINPAIEQTHKAILRALMFSGV